MFGSNEVVGKKYFAGAPEGSLLVTSIFATLQGEGPFSGKPAVFIRLAKCNLNCHFCDTYFDSGDWMTFEQINNKIYDEIQRVSSARARQFGIVITGGEPLLQENLGAFTQTIAGWFDFIQIESNGIIAAPKYLSSDTRLIISPKCNKADRYITPHEKNLDRAMALKFVVAAEGPYSTIPDWALEAAENGKRVYISPMNIYNKEPEQSKILRATKKDITLDERSKVDEVISFWEEGLLNKAENEKNHKYAAEYCIRHGLTLSLQQHLYAGIA